MLISEMTTSQGRPQVYVDMDGVLCDFFGAWAQQLGGKPGSNWEYIKTLPRHQTDASIRDLSRDPQQVEEFFANLEPLAGGQRIIKMLRASGRPWAILSAPLRGVNADASIAGKETWLDRHGLADVPRIFERDKYKYATADDGSANVLIDDYGKNIGEWRAHGGVAIKHDNDTTDQTLAELKQILK